MVTVSTATDGVRFFFMNVLLGFQQKDLIMEVFMNCPSS